MQQNDVDHWTYEVANPLASPQQIADMTESSWDEFGALEDSSTPLGYEEFDAGDELFYLEDNEDYPAVASEAGPQAAPMLTFDNGLPIRNAEAHRIRPEEIFVATPDRNHTRRDYEGAFRPEARAFCALHGVDPERIVRINITQREPQRAQQLNAALAATRPKVIALFCHGSGSNIQLGLRSPKNRPFRADDRRNFDQFLDLAARVPNVSVVLYACSTGRDFSGDPNDAPGAGDDSLADLIRDGLCMRGATACRVFAHTTVAHTTRNACAKFFDGNYSPVGGTGAPYIANPGTAAFRLLRTTLRTPASDLRFRLPFLTIPRIFQLIGAASPSPTGVAVGSAV